MKKNDLVELEIDSLACGGNSVSRLDGMAIFTKYGVPQSKVRARITRKKNSYAEALIEETLEHSPKERTPECPYFGNCGGCSWQNVDYAEQVAQKKQIVLDSLIRIGKLEVAQIDEPLAAPHPLNYRNKMEFSFSASRWLTKAEIALGEDEIADKHFAFGLHAPGRFDKVLDIDKCRLQHERANELFAILKSAAEKSGTTAYNHVKHEGFLRNFLLRYSYSNNQVMAMLVTNRPESPEELAFMEYYRTKFADNFTEKDTLLHGINATNSPVDIQETNLIKGTGYINEKILDIGYRISPESFFQTNSSQLNAFISKILEFADIKKDDVVWDLYCGAGSITLPASRKCSNIYGIELVESAVADARDNAKRNGIKNAHFYCEDLHKKQLPEMINSLPKPDIIIVDPPRAGMHKNVVDHIHTLAPKRFVYVSCNPTTQARDLEMLKDIYKITELVPVDLFPHTYHVESICKLELRDE